MDLDRLTDFFDNGDCDDEILDHVDDPDDGEGEGNALMSFEDSQQSSTSLSTELTFCESDSDMLEEDVDPPEQMPLVFRHPPASPAVPAKITLGSDMPCSMRSGNGHDISMSDDSSSFTVSDVLSRRDKAVAVVASDAPALDKIHAVFDQIDCDLLNGESQIGVSLNVRPAPGSDKRALSKARTKRVCFPGKSTEEAWRFGKSTHIFVGSLWLTVSAAVIIRILDLLRDALVAGTTISKRELYYRAPSLFRSQQVVDRNLDLIASTFAVPRAALSVTAAAKGLVFGACSLRRSDGSELSLTSEQEGRLIAGLKDILSASLDHVRWILVIEKEASFRSLVSDPTFFARVSCQGMLVTGKGYPDLNTRALLHFVSTPSPRNGFAAPPVYALVDFDPDGLAIMDVYRHGSSALAHEGDSVCVPSLKWMGLGSPEVVLAASSGRTAGEEGLLLLSDRDRGKAKRMLERCTDEEQRAELQRMLMLGVKAELQMLETMDNGMTGWVGRRLDALGH